MIQGVVNDAYEAVVAISLQGPVGHKPRTSKSGVVRT